MSDPYQNQNQGNGQPMPPGQEQFPPMQGRTGPHQYGPPSSVPLGQPPSGQFGPQPGIPAPGPTRQFGQAGGAEIILAPGELPQISDTFSPNIVLAWLRTRITLTDRRIVAKSPNTLAGVIPLGYREQSMPRGAVAALTVNVRFRALRAVMATILLILAILFLTSSNGGGDMIVNLVIFAIAVILGLTSLTAALEVTNHGGGVQAIQVSILEKTKLEHFRDAVNQIIYAGP